ncbi:MAG TPA: GNAT family N-acetyltransferase [Dokdonella sp.]
MIAEDFHVELADWNADAAALRGVRERVFVEEQHVPREDEWDALDARSRHVLARDPAGRAIGTGRLTPERTIGRMAVVPEWRGRGVGAAMLRVLIEQARALGHPAVELHAQVHAIPFYEKFGFAASGAEFDECGIAHRHMRLELAPAAAREPSPLPPRTQARALVVEDRVKAAAAVLALFADARHELAIYTRDLDPALLDVPAALDALKRVALSGRRARIRILVQEPRKPLVEGHRLIPLAQRLPSAIALRTPVDERERQYPSAFLLNDRGGYLFRPLGSRLEGVGSTCAPGRHAQLRERFDQAWERAIPSAELRELAF